jgi:cytochrome c-type biogenesis protein CcmH/NrfF
MDFLYGVSYVVTYFRYSVWLSWQLPPNQEQEQKFRFLVGTLHDIKCDNNQQ